MILAALLLQVSAPQTAVDAERAFNAAAQAKGQWTAFREFAATDATMFVPQPVKAQEWLRDRKDPPRSVEWWPTESWISCDGKLAVNTGGWKQPDGSEGYFSTVWRKEADGSWKWIVDHRDTLKTARERPAEVRVTHASCEGRPQPQSSKGTPGIWVIGAAPDDTLDWNWFIWTHGERSLSVRIWNGTSWLTVLNAMVMPAK